MSLMYRRDIRDFTQALCKLGLSRAHQETIHCISYGMTNKEIADKLGISVKTVKFRITQINKVLKTKNRMSAVRETFNIIERECCDIIVPIGSKNFIEV